MILLIYGTDIDNYLIVVRPGLVCTCCVHMYTYMREGKPTESVCERERWSDFNLSLNS